MHHLHRNTHGVMMRPASDQSRADAVLVDAGSASPFRDRQRYSVRRNSTTRATVIRLLSLVGPSAIVWTVGTVIVFALDGVLRRRTTPHVSEKLREAVSPLIAHNDAASAVVTKVVMFLRMATAAHIRPCAVLCAASAAMRAVVSARLNAQAPTTLGFSETNLSRADGCLRAATASAPNHLYGIVFMRWFKDGQLSECPTHYDFGGGMHSQFYHARLV